MHLCMLSMHIYAQVWVHVRRVGYGTVQFSPRQKIDLYKTDRIKCLCLRMPGQMNF